MDANYWVALLDSRDALHPQALELGRVNARTPQITSELVLIELLNHFCGRGPEFRLAVARFIQRLRMNPGVVIVPSSTGQFDAALKLYAERPDKPWSLVDCASFLIMQGRRLTDALAYDRHFEQAGFRPLLRSPR